MKEAISMKMKPFYLALRAFLKAVTPNMTTLWEEPFDGGLAVFCPNHAGVWGPVDMCVHFDLRETARPWFNAAVADPKQVPAYVRQDYWWEPGCKLEPLYNATLPYLAAAVLPPILNSVPGVKVYHDLQVIKTFRQSIDYLKQDQQLIIFPQQPSGYQSHHMKINKGFLQIAPMAWRTLKAPIKFYPVYIDHAGHTITVRRPIAFDPERTLKEQEQELLDYLAHGLLKDPEKGE